MASYYFSTSIPAPVTWTTANPTTKFDDASPGDTTTSETRSVGSTIPFALTGFCDLGSSVALSAWQFTYAMSVTHSWAFAGSNDTSSWTTILSGGSAPVLSTTRSGTSATPYRYYRLTIAASSNGPGSAIISDWRLTPVSSRNPSNGPLLTFS